MKLDREQITREVFVLTLEPEDMAGLLTDLSKVADRSTTGQAIIDEFENVDGPSDINNTVPGEPKEEQEIIGQ